MVRCRVGLQEIDVREAPSLRKVQTAIVVQQLSANRDMISTEQTFLTYYISKNIKRIGTASAVSGWEMLVMEMLKCI